MTEDIKKYTAKNLTNIAPENSGLKVGDLVEWVNDYGVTWQHRVLGFSYKGWYNEKYSKFVHLDTDCYWFPHSHLELKKLNNVEAA